MEKLMTSQISYVAIGSVDDTTARKYKEVKLQKSEEEKDILIEKLLRDTAVAEALNACNYIPNMHRNALSQWVGTENTLSPFDTAMQNFNLFIKKNKPNFVGFNKPEILLIFAIKMLEEKNIHVYADTDGKKLLCWIVCDKKDYLLLDKSMELINQYEIDNKVSVDVMFMSLSQFANGCPPEFAFCF